jgi:hypothetical protein
MPSRFIQSLVAALAMGAIVAPGAVATVDLRSPDARDAATASTRDISSSIPIDLRSPDARDAATTSTHNISSSIPIDLRSPDARDVARGLTRVRSATPPVEISATDSGWFDWASAGIGVVALALLLAGAAGVRTGARRMRGHVAT